MSDVYQLNLDEEVISHLIDPDFWVAVNAEGVSPALIEDDEVRAMFEWQRDHIRKHGRPATATVLAEEWELDEVNEPETAIGDLLDRLREDYARNTGRETVRDIVRQQQDENDGPLAIPQLLITKGRELAAVLFKRDEIFGTEDVDRAKHHYDKKVQRGPGASLGFEMLDDYFYGQRGVTMVLAPPKTMKSWIICQMVLANAWKGNLPYFYTLELPADEADMRLRCLMADVPWKRYLRNDMDTTHPDWDDIRKSTDELLAAGMYRVIKPDAGHRGIEEMVQRARDAGAGAIFIDQLQYVETAAGETIGTMNATGSYWEVLNAARDLSDEGPICFAHQFNRSAMFADEMPRVEQAKGSSSIEEVATLALGMWGNRDMRSEHWLEVSTLIARNHQYRSWEMDFDLSEGCTFEINRRVDDAPDDS